MFAIMKSAQGGEQVFGDGVLEVLPDGFGFLRSPTPATWPRPTTSTSAQPDPPLQPAQWRPHRGRSAPPKDGERYFALVKVDRVNGRRPNRSKNKIMFENLTAVPQGAVRWNAKASRAKRTSPAASSTCPPSAKASAPCSSAQPKTGKTVMMKHIAHAHGGQPPDCHLIVLLVTSARKEVTEMVAPCGRSDQLHLRRAAAATCRWPRW